MRQKRDIQKIVNEVQNPTTLDLRLDVSHLKCSKGVKEAAIEFLNAGIDFLFTDNERSFGHIFIDRRFFVSMQGKELMIVLLPNEQALLNAISMAVINATKCESLVYELETGMIMKLKKRIAEKYPAYKFIEVVSH